MKVIPAQDKFICIIELDYIKQYLEKQPQLKQIRLSLIDFSFIVTGILDDKIANIEYYILILVMEIPRMDT